MKKILDQLPSNNIVDAWRCIAIAEDKIKEFQQKYPKHKKELYNSFKSLCPNNILDGKLNLYESHCDEILQRVIDGEDIDCATNAELCVIFSEMSLKSPINESYSRAYEYCFNKVFGEN